MAYARVPLERDWGARLQTEQTGIAAGLNRLRLPTAVAPWRCAVMGFIFSMGQSCQPGSAPPRARRYGSEMGHITFRFKKGLSVGDVDAEFDRFLAEAFHDTGDLDLLRDTNVPKSVVVGRTGAGKTALLKRLEETSERVLRIDPATLSLQYLSNTTIIPYLQRLGVKLDLFYALLWRHILVMEIIRHHFDLREEAGQRSFWRKIADLWTLDKSEKHALEYYTEWNPSFWESSDVRVKEITNALKQRVEEKLGVDLSARVGESDASIGAGVAGSSGNESVMETRERAEIVERAQSVVREVSLERIQAGMEIVRKKVLNDRQRPYYIIIDDLDLHWVDTTLAYDLIEALLDAVGSFAKIENVKVVVALRENIVEIIHSRRSGQRQQREKHESVFLRLRWSEADLISLMDKRLSALLRNQYGGNVSLEDFLPDARMGKPPSGLEYMLARTFRRPRDLIEYVNKCLEHAAIGQSNRISWKILADAERDYSVGRLRSLEDEWSPTYPDIDVVFRAFDGSVESFSLASLEDNRLINTLVTGERAEDPNSVARLVYEMDKQGRSYSEIWLALAEVLFRVGFLGVKATPQEPMTFSYQQPSLTVGTLPGESRFAVHPALHLALHVRVERKNGKG